MAYERGKRLELSEEEINRMLSERKINETAARNFRLRNEFEQLHYRQNRTCDAAIELLSEKIFRSEGNVRRIVFTDVFIDLAKLAKLIKKEDIKGTVNHNPIKDNAL